MDDQDVELEEIMKRMEQGARIVKGTLLIDGENIMRTSFDNTTSCNLVKYSGDIKRACENFVRELKVTDKLEYIRIDYPRFQFMMGVEDDFKAIIIQEYKARDLRFRSRDDQKNPSGYNYTNKDFLFTPPDK